MRKEPLRKCRDCGLEAHTENDLSLFSKRETSLHGRRNWCKACDNKKAGNRKRSDDRIYLKNKLNNIKQRCNNPNTHKYSHYGGRGITVCDEWLNNKQAFIDWALNSGWNRNLEIDRIDNEGPYSPSNCHWVTRQKQNMNKRNTVTFLKKGTRICRICKIDKPLTDFNRDKSQFLKRKYICRPCDRETQKKRRMLGLGKT